MVKTPGLSPIKTRLAQTIGREAAEHLYALCVDCMRELLGAWHKETGKISAWAVAENQGRTHSLWQSFTTLAQGEGGLGARMATVSEEILQTNGFAILIGADAPQLEITELRKARYLLETGVDVVLGPSADGGFYLIAIAKPLPRSIWEGVEYSTDSTRAAFARACESLGLRVDQTTLPCLTDLDEGKDMISLRQELAFSDRPATNRLREALRQGVPN